MTELSALEQKYIGTEVGSFQIRSLLGMGGMGAVFLAKHKLVGCRRPSSSCAIRWATLNSRAGF